MTPFTYQAGRLHAEAVPLARIADEVGTPAYVYSSAMLEDRYRALDAALTAALGKGATTLCYAVKANSNLAVIHTFAILGAGADVDSEGELRRALAAGVPAGRIVFSGVGKTLSELDYAVSAGIMQINIESAWELDAVDAIGRARGVRVPIGLRVNPHVDAHTHDKITTGKAENKFGIDWNLAPEIITRAATLPGIDMAGIATHIGSQIVETDPFRAAFQRLRDLVLLVRGHGVELRRVDLGGGLGVVYDDETPPDPAAYAAAAKEMLGDLGCSYVVEPGRFLVGNAGVLLARVITVKEGVERSFAIVDAGMNDLIRPALYQAHHGILPIRQPAAGTALKTFDVVGPVCETGDTFATQRALPPLASGDLVAFMSAGAYGAVMASMYNSRPLVPEVLVSGDRYTIIRPRPSYEQMLAMDRFADWQRT